MLKSAIYVVTLICIKVMSMVPRVTYVFALPELAIKFTVANKKTVGNAMSHKMTALGGRAKSEGRITLMPCSRRA